MKNTIVALGLLVSFSSFASEINGFKVSNLPTASQSYSQSVSDEKDILSSKEKVAGKCLAGKAKAEAFAKSNGFKVISSKGCEVSVNDNRNEWTINGSIDLATSFEVIFK